MSSAETNQASAGSSRTDELSRKISAHVIEGLSEEFSNLNATVTALSVTVQRLAAELSLFIASGAGGKASSAKASSSGSKSSGGSRPKGGEDKYGVDESKVCNSMLFARMLYLRKDLDPEFRDRCLNAENSTLSKEALEAELKSTKAVTDKAEGSLDRLKAEIKVIWKHLTKAEKENMKSRHDAWKQTREAKATGELLEAEEDDGLASEASTKDTSQVTLAELDDLLGGDAPPF